MASPVEPLPDDTAALKAALLSATTRSLQIEAELAVAKARASDDRAMIAHQQLQIAKLRHQLLQPAFGARRPTARPTGARVR